MKLLFRVAIGLSIFLGHCFPIYHNYRGGKGVIVSLVILSYLALPIAGAAALIWLLVFCLFGRVSLASLIAAIGAAFTSYTVLATPEILLVHLLTIGLFFQHRENIKRLLNGKEKALITPFISRLLR